MPTAKERLGHLLALAGEGGVQRAALAGELADLLLDWPPDCPTELRAALLALFKQTVRDIDEAARAKLAARMGGHGELPLDLVNEFYLCAPAPVRREILMRNELAGEEDADDDAVSDAVVLVTAARAKSGDFAGQFGVMLGIAPSTARKILNDASGEALAVACKGAHLDRAAFSALALLQKNGVGDDLERLAVYDTVPSHAAERLTRFWRAYHASSEQSQFAAAG